MTRSRYSAQMNIELDKTATRLKTEVPHEFSEYRTWLCVNQLTKGCVYRKRHDMPAVRLAVTSMFTVNRLLRFNFFLEYNGKHKFLKKNLTKSTNSSRIRSVLLQTSIMLSIRCEGNWRSFSVWRTLCFCAAESGCETSLTWTSTSWSYNSRHTPLGRANNPSPYNTTSCLLLQPHVADGAEQRFTNLHLIHSSGAMTTTSSLNIPTPGTGNRKVQSHSAAGMQSMKVTCNLLMITYRTGDIFKRGGERFNECRWYVRNEPHGVYKENFESIRQKSSVHGDVKRCKQLVSRLHRFLARQSFNQTCFSFKTAPNVIRVLTIKKH